MTPMLIIHSDPDVVLFLIEIVLLVVAFKILIYVGCGIYLMIKSFLKSTCSCMTDLYQWREERSRLKTRLRRE